MAPRKTDAELYFEVTDVTPAMAMKWLEQNHNNRPIGDKRVDAYARVMKAGGWRVNNQAIAFDKNGVLVDGQHRLWAIIQAAIPIRISVAYNMDPDAVKTIDRGATRTVAEVLRREGQVPSPKRVAAWCNGERLMITNCSSKGSVEDTEDYYTKNKRAIDFLLATMPDAAPFKPAMIGAALVFVLARKRLVAEDFVTRMVSGAGLEAGSPALECREVIISNAGVAGQKRALGLKILRCMQAEIKGETLKRRHVYATEPSLHYFQNSKAA